MIPCGTATPSRLLPRFSSVTRGRLFKMIIKRNTFTLVETRHLDNIKLSVCGIGLLTHITRWTEDNHNVEGILDRIYDMSHHDPSAAVGYMELLEEEIIENFFSEQELQSIQALAEL
jgi:hypothetical protein